MRVTMSGTPPRLPVALNYFATDRSLPVADFARAAAELGFDGVLLPEHTHIPVCTEAPYTGDLPERYRRTLDPYVALSVVAAQTDLQIGTCISLVARHDPIALAKTIATLDFISGGRFSLGVGYGWNVPELANHGHEAAKRRAIGATRLPADTARLRRDRRLGGRLDRLRQRPRPQCWRRSRARGDRPR